MSSHTLTNQEEDFEPFVDNQEQQSDIANVAPQSQGVMFILFYYYYYFYQCKKFVATKKSLSRQNISIMRTWPGLSRAHDLLCRDATQRHTVAVERLCHAHTA